MDCSNSFKYVEEKRTELFEKSLVWDELLIFIKLRLDLMGLSNELKLYFFSMLFNFSLFEYVFVIGFFFFIFFKFI